MRSVTRSLVGAAMLAMVNSQAVILSAVGDSGTSLGLQVDTSNPNDANFISIAELTANVVNECGRTLAAGNIDIGENTEDALAVGNVTKVTKGSSVKITIDQRNANGTGPFTCDLDETSNASGTSGQVALVTTQGTSTSTTGQLTLSVAMPSDMACIGASTGNVCTIRCRNAQDFGGCVAVQQTDTTPNANTPANITTAQTLAGIQAQIQQNKIDLQAAVKGNQQATTVSEQGVDIAQAILDADPTIVQDAEKEVQTNTVSTAAAAATTSAAAKKANGNASKGKGNGKAKGNNAKAAANNNNNNNKRESAIERRKRYVNAGVDYAPEGGN